MKNLLLFSFILLQFSSCSSPKTTAQDFLEAMNSSQFETAMNLVTEESKPILYGLINHQTKDIPKVNIKIKGCAETGEKDTTTCVYVISNSEGETFEKPIKLLKQNNIWKVDLTQRY